MFKKFIGLIIGLILIIVVIIGVVKPDDTALEFISVSDISNA